MREPTRLCDGDELPSALRDAFRALEREAPSAELTARVEQVLHGLPAAAPGAVAVSALSTGKLLTLATLLVGSAASLVVLRSAGTPAPAARSVESAAPTEARPEPARAPETESHVVRPVQRAEAAAVPSAAEPSSPAKAERRERTLPQTRELSATQRRERVETHAVARSTAWSSTRTAVATASIPPEISAVEEASRASDEPLSRPADEPVPRTSEARLLADAKRLGPRDPAGALRQVEVLAAQFPAGLFVQERMMLAIQLHRQLGHDALAEQLAREFQERYPRSVYGRALPP